MTDEEYDKLTATARELSDAMKKADAEGDSEESNRLFAEYKKVGEKMSAYIEDTFVFSGAAVKMVS